VFFFLEQVGQCQCAYWEYVWFFGQVGHCEGIYWECVWFGGTGRAVRKYILRLRMVWWNR